MADLLGKTITYAGVTTLPDRKILNFIGGDGAALSVADNPATGATDVTIGGAGGTIGAGGVLLTSADNGKTLVNSGAVVWTLPAAALGLTFRIINAVAGGTTIDAAGTDIIEIAGLASSAGGTFNTTDVFGSVLLAAIAGKWIAIGQPIGIWTAA
jgi:hypothetical protein